MRSILTAAVITSLVLAGCANSWVDEEASQHARRARPASGQPGTVPPTTVDRAQPATFAQGSCPMPLPDDDRDRVRCGVLDVALDRTVAQGPRAEVAVAVIESQAEQVQPDPVVYLHGGPGGLALWDYVEWVFPEHPLLADRDIVLLDQRGSGLSEPSLNCPEAEDSAEPVAALARCADDLRSSGIELESFTTAEVAADIADLRLALGIEQWNLYGVSYGSRVALTAMTIDSAGIRSVVLDSPYPPEVDAYGEQVANAADAIDAVLSSCVDDTRCRDRFGDLRPELDQLLESLAADPVQVTLESAPDQPRLVVDDAVLAAALFSALYDRFTVPDVPLAVQHAIDGELATALDLLGVHEGFHPARQESDDEYESLFDSELAFWAPECAEEIGAADFDDIASSIDAADPVDVALLDEVDSAFTVCDRLDVEAVDPTTQGAIRSDVPTLLLVGQFDPITPPQWARRAAASLTNSAVVEVTGSGHAPAFEQCPRDAMVSFINELTLPPPVPCLDDLRPLPFSLE